MNYLITILLVTFSFTSFCKGKQVAPFYIIESENYDETIPAGKFKVSGIVYYGSAQSRVLVSFADFSSPSFEGINVADQNGKFSFLISDTAKIVKISSQYNVDFKNLQNGIHYIISIYCPLIQVEVCKPVIYAYSEKNIDFIINLKTKGELTFTYPNLSDDNSWKMKTVENGNLISEDGAKFPYLFWEAKQDASSLDLSKTSSNQIIAGKDLVSYFEKELTKLGFNAKEKTDFITYWCPKFSESNMVQVQFFVDDNCSVIGELNISPKPDNLRRIYVLFQTDINIITDFIAKPLNVKPFDRNGFTVLEWGGSELKSYENGNL